MAEVLRFSFLHFWFGRTERAVSISRCINHSTESTKTMDEPEWSIADWQQAFESREWTSLELCEQFQRRIEQIDLARPKLQSVIEVNPDAVQIAETLDQQRQQHTERGPLDGVPIVLKDSLDTAHRMMTTGGSLALSGNYAARDATVVSPLRGRRGFCWPKPA